MTRLKWDKESERLYEAGLDRGVLYGPDLYLDHLAGIVWNGLTAFDIKPDDASVQPVYFDGVKIFDSVSPGDFAGTLKAFTYPDQFNAFQGITDDNVGLYYDNQPRYTFGLSFRTYMGNPDKGTNFGYKIHICYNLTAMATQTTRQTITSNVDPIEFEWDVTGTPTTCVGADIRPTAHIIIDSTEIDPDRLITLENNLYGFVDVDGPGDDALPNSYMPTLCDVIGIIEGGG